MAADEGLVATSAATEDWKPDPDIPGSEMHELVHADGVWVGMTRFTSVDGPVTWTPETREVAMVIEGAVRIQVTGGEEMELGVGDLFSIAPGVETTWTFITTPFKEMWVLAG